MPLIVCPDCGREMSSAAAACPQCGRPATRSVWTDPKVGRTAALLVLAAVVAVPVGFVHVVYGAHIPGTVCAKDGWSLTDTIVDADDYIGQPLITQLDRAKVLRALFACGVLKRPEWPESERH
jgi:hypothetical protein